VTFLTGLLESQMILLRTHATDLYISPQHVAALSHNKSRGDTQITMVNGEYFFVQTPLDEVANSINEALRRDRAVVRTA